MKAFIYTSLYDRGFAFPFMNFLDTPKARNSFNILNGNIVFVIFIFKKTSFKKTPLFGVLFTELGYKVKPTSDSVIN